MPILEGVVTTVISGYLSDAIRGSAAKISKEIGSILFGDEKATARLNIELENYEPVNKPIYDSTEKIIGNFRFRFYLARFGLWNKDIMQNDFLITVNAFILGPLCPDCKTSVKHMEFKERKFRGDVFHCKNCNKNYHVKSVDDAAKKAAAWFEEVIPRVLDI